MSDYFSNLMKPAALRRTAYAVVFLYTIWYLLFLYSETLLPVRSRDLAFLPLLIITFLLLLPLSRHLRLSHLISAGILLRIFSLPAAPFTTDLYRYLSDGLNILQGLNPYTTGPVHPLVDYPEIRSLYPPGGQLLFALGALTESVYAYKLIFGLFEAGSACLLLRATGYRDSSLNTFLLLNPLFLHESWGEGHLESASLFFMITALLLIKRKKLNTAAFLGLGSVAVKLHGVFLLPLLVSFRNRPLSALFKTSNLIRVLLFIAAAVTVVLPVYIFKETEALQGMQMYTQYWVFAQPLYELLRGLSFSQTESIRYLQIIIAGSITVAALAYLAGFIRQSGYLLLSLTAFLLIFPVQHPWYYQIAAVLFLFRSYRLFFIILLSLVQLNYFIYAGFSEMIQLIIFLCAALIYLSVRFNRRAEPR